MSPSTSPPEPPKRSEGPYRYDEMPTVRDDTWVCPCEHAISWHSNITGCCAITELDDRCTCPSKRQELLDGV